MSQLGTPRIEINLAKIAHNAKNLVRLYDSKGIGIMAVTKTVCGEPAVANALVNQGIHTLADSKLKNIKRMREAGITAQFVLLRSPAISEVSSVIKHVDISMNTELAVIKKLSAKAIDSNIRHKIILMIEMGDLREGIMPDTLEEFIKEVLNLSGIEIVGIGANFACFGGVKPSGENIRQLSSLAETMEEKFRLPLSFVSGGNSANYNWFMSTSDTEKINNLRLGESIYLGRETLNRMVIPGLYTDAFTLVSEIIELKSKPSVPYGEIGQDAFGKRPQFQDIGQMKRAIMGVGSQDILVSGLTPRLDIDIIGSSSDHTVLNMKKANLKVGDELRFDLNYGALLLAMTSPYVSKEYVGTYKIYKDRIGKRPALEIEMFK
ncbi:putative amino acid racemase [Virgibacillus natechei]|uniref:Amino acid racemase n=1 Tax=Virgibacillus natechei TaxID=1216297 RepID=A0ABS4IH65_9BACI|nr:alanine/ornithine racemase family PLP-dependent enzyme [Virgibacillus natechei]MBP1970289.1 putative amino acid racemase [Virgibacillus natechei]UZD13117.1 alanine/ornithine racemase family PLP-dependent enzyme [Virgibacillus natechei]